MKRFFIFLTIVAFLGAGFCLGQTQTDQSSLSKSNSNFSLFSPEKLKMSHSYSLNYFSGKSGSFSFGVYTNTIQYQLSQSIKMKLDLNFLHSPTSIFSRYQTDVKSKIFPNFQFSYKPNNSFSLFINYQTVPYYQFQPDRDFWQW